MDYTQFLQTKIDIAPDSGFDVSADELNPILLPHERDAVCWAIRGGRRALFESFGMGKTVQELEWARLIAKHSAGQVLIIIPLGVRQEFQRDAQTLLGMEKLPYIRTEAEAGEHREPPIVITNYERVRDGDIDVDKFAGVVLDEASVLRDFGSKTYQTFLGKFKKVRYKLVATATPSPNRYKELIHYAGFLGIMDTGQALTRYFQRDSTKANNLTLYPHMEKEFWLWMSSWALFLQKPSDLGYSDEGYDLPPMTVNWHKISVDNTNAGCDRFGQYKLIRDSAFGLQDAAREKRESIQARLDKAMEIINSDPDARFILWHDLEAERHAIEKALPDCSTVYGTQDYDEREKRVIAFSDGEGPRVLATKKSICGSGCNFQRHCHREIFMGIDYEFNDFIQAIHRVYRFQQKEQVVIDIIYMESEAEIKKVLLQKWNQHIEMTQKMEDILKRYGMNNANRFDDMRRTIGCDRQIVTGENFVAVNNDCVDEVSHMADNSIDLIVTSIPFGNHYEYTPSYNDFGHNPDNDAFFAQMDYLSPHLMRVLKPGRVFCCHVKDRILFGNATGTGMPTVDPFHMLTTLHYMKHGFQFMGMITVVTDVVRENNQTYRLGWTECCKDHTKMGIGCPEYILLFRKLPSDTSKGYADNPVSREKSEYSRAQWQIDAHAFWRSSGNRHVTREELLSTPVDELQSAYRAYSREHVYDYEEHVQLAKSLEEKGKLPASFMVVAPGSWAANVWDDVNRMRTYNTTQSAKRKQNHVCPLQIDIVTRLINEYSNPGEVVLDPFGGLMTVPCEAVKLGRKGIGVELNSGYFADGVAYLEAADAQANAPTLFDLINESGPA